MNTTITVLSGITGSLSLKGLMFNPCVRSPNVAAQIEHSEYGCVDTLRWNLSDHEAVVLTGIQYKEGNQLIKTGMAV